MCSFCFFYLFAQDYSYLDTRLFLNFLILVIYRFLKKEHNKISSRFALTICLFLLEMTDPEGLSWSADSEDSLQSTARSHQQQPAADAAAVPPGGAAQPQGPLPGIPIALGSPEAINVVQDIFAIIEPRIDALTERAGLVIGTEEQHLSFLHRMAFSIVHDVEPLTHPSLEVLQGLKASLEQNPLFLDSLIRDRLNNRNMD